MSGWLEGGDGTMYRSAHLLRHGDADDPDMVALTMGAVGHTVRQMLEEPPPKRPRLEIAVHITITAHPRGGDEQ
ncbi:MAG TPA: hypothetical protein VM283_06575 [Armatimonadota bacterium]|nr:hypothetical protein [Armatimonadota bacterium]